MPRNYSPVHVIKEDLLKWKQEIWKLQSEKLTPEIEAEIASFRKIIKDTEEYLERNRERLEDFGRRGLQTQAIKAREVIAHDNKTSRVRKLETYNRFIRQERSAIKVLIKKFRYFNPKRASYYRTKELAKIREKLLKRKANLDELLRRRKAYLLGLPPADPPSGSFEINVYKAEYERRLRGGRDKEEE